MVRTALLVLTNQINIELISLRCCLLAEEPAINARHTIDCMRKRIELSTGSDRYKLGQSLVRHPDSICGPTDLTSRLLSLLVVVHGNGELACEAYGKVASLLIEKLEHAVRVVEDSTQEGMHLLGMLGILLDASMELMGKGIMVGTRTVLDGRAARLFVKMIWRDAGLVKVAAGILDRLEERNWWAASAVAADVLLAIVAKLGQELGDAPGSDTWARAGPLKAVAPVFSTCLSIMLVGDHDHAVLYIRKVLLRPLTSLVKETLKRTIENSGDERIAELDEVSTTLYNFCDDVLHRR